MLREWRRKAPLQVRFIINSRSFSSSFPQLEAKNYDRNYDQNYDQKIMTKIMESFVCI